MAAIGQVIVDGLQQRNRTETRRVPLETPLRDDFLKDGLGKPNIRLLLAPVFVILERRFRRRLARRLCVLRCALRRLECSPDFLD